MKQIRICRTEGEWDKIESALREQGYNGDVSRYVNNKTTALLKRFRECKKCITACEGDIYRKPFWFDDHTYQGLQELSAIMKKPTGAIINELVIAPILFPKS